MSIKTLIKDPDESKIYVIDFSSLLATGETLSSPVLTSSPSGLTLGTPVISDGTVQVRISGGTSDIKYDIDVTVNTSLANILNDTIYLIVQPTGWQYELVLMLRLMINDLSATPTYTDERLKQVLVMAAQYVASEIENFAQTYTINMAELSISPDPTDDATRENAFINLVVLKAACFMDVNMLRTKALLAGLKATLGPAALAVDGTHLAGFVKILEKGPCAAYNEEKKDYKLGNIPIQAILSPFVHNKFDPRNLYSVAHRDGVDGGSRDSFF